MTISTHALNSASDAAEYYLSEENYYTRNESEEALSRSEWFGEGAEKLGLSGNIDPVMFEKLLAGELPDGQRIGIMKEGEWQHRPGVDITFNVPKSVSLLVRFTKDDKLREAVHEAIAVAAKSTLAQIEKNYAGARQTENGQTTFVKTGNLIVALFKHDLSRAGDPHEHIHAVIKNITQRPDGEWRSLASDMQHYSTTEPTSTIDFLSCVRKDRLYFNMRFWGALAYGLCQLGLTVERTHERGSFEIVGISKRSIEAFSTRANQIAAYIHHAA